jgi:uncharacterized membrane protein YhaH (DUF805 family)
MYWYKKVVFENYANFNGRARRSEYWYFILFNILFSTVTKIIDNLLGFEFGSSNSGILNTIYGLVVFIPGLAVSVRRLHDIGKSGWLLLIAYSIIIFLAVLLVIGGITSFANSSFSSWMFIPLLLVLAIAIWLLVLFCTEGDDFTNKYGKDPKDIFADDIDDIGTDN